MNIERLTKILRLSPIEVFDYFAQMAKEVGYSPDSIVYEPNVFLAITGSDIAFVAHVDTVWEHKPNMQLNIINNKIIQRKRASSMDYEGLGADDRLGICALEDLLRVYPNFRPSIYLCNFEEIGGLGAQILDEIYDNEITIRAFIELDRKGRNDAVFYRQPTALFRQLILEEGFMESEGSFSDISFLGGNYSFMYAPSVNISVGYMYEHTANESIVIPWYDELLRRIYKLYIKLLNEKREFDFYASTWGYSKSECNEQDC